MEKGFFYEADCSFEGDYSKVYIHNKLSKQWWIKRVLSLGGSKLKIQLQEWFFLCIPA